MKEGFDIISFPHEIDFVYLAGQLTLLKNTKEMRHFYANFKELHRRLMRREEKIHCFEEKIFSVHTFKFSNVSIYFSKVQVIDWTFQDRDNLFRWNRGKLFRNITSLYGHRNGFETKPQLEIDQKDMREKEDVTWLKIREPSWDVFRKRDGKMYEKRGQLAVEVAFFHFMIAKYWKEGISVTFDPHGHEFDLCNQIGTKTFFITNPGKF